MMDAEKYIAQNPVIREVSEKKETVWVNPRYLPFDMTNAVCSLVVSDAMIDDAAERLQRFAPFIERCFPETETTHGLIESPLKAIPTMQQALEKDFSCTIPGQLLLKMDSHLAIAGSIKARGGIYEVLKHAEDLALTAGKLQVTDNYAKLADPEMKEFFHQYTVQEGPLETWACPSGS